jgi:MYXO-CTERM domain-containing protein
MRRLGLLTVVLLLAPSISHAASGSGPGGYSWMDCQEPGGPSCTYTTQAFSDGVTALCSDETYSISFASARPGYPGFPFYGSVYSSLTISANGVIYLQNPMNCLPSTVGCDATNQALTGTENRAFVAVLWDDWAMDNNDLTGFFCGNPGCADTGQDWLASTTESYRVGGGNDCADFVDVEWFGTAHHSPCTDPGNTGVNEATFGVRLYADGRIVMRYDDLNVGNPALDDGVSATIGVSSGANGEHTQVSFNTAVPTVPYALEFAPPPPCSDLDFDSYCSIAEGGQDCDDTNAQIHPGATELCNGVDDNCDGVIDDVDGDSDGFLSPACGGDDCNDSDPTIHPGALDVFCDGIDQDCDGTDLCVGCPVVPPAPNEGGICNGIDDDCDGLVDDGTICFDDDGDGFTEVGGDCDDSNPNVHPAATEEAICNGIDEDCNGVPDDGTDCSDDDGDGRTELGGDCNDEDPLVGGANADEGTTGDGRDNDCDGVVDNGTDAFDDDGDGYSESEGDCDDGDAGRFPGATELENALDDDCDGSIDEGTDGSDGDGDGFCPGLDLDGDGTDECSDGSQPGDCDDGSFWVGPEAEEVCDGLDNDCNDEVDEVCNEDEETLIPSSGTSQGGCDCEHAPAAGRSPLALFALLPALALLRRRRERRRSSSGRAAIGVGLLAALGAIAGGCSDVGVSIRLGDLQFTPAVLDFGAVPLGAAADEVLTLANVGDANLNIPSVTLEGPDRDFFELVDAGTTELGGNSSVGVVVRFRPNNQRPHQAKLVVLLGSRGDTRKEIVLRGLGMNPVLQVFPGRVDFGLVPAGDPESRTLTVANVSTVELEILDWSVSNTEFTLIDPPAYGAPPFTMAPGDQATVQLQLLPTSDDPIDALLSIQSTDTFSPLTTVTISANDCNGSADPGYDADGDGYTRCGGDCDDGSPLVGPGFPEQPDGLDNDCDGTADEGTSNYDDDGDCFCEVGTCTGSSDPSCTVLNPGDCDDTDDRTAPGAPETADGRDNSCDGRVDEGTDDYDDDGDGFTENGGDCDDDNNGAFPNNPAPVQGNGIDDDCDGVAE